MAAQVDTLLSSCNKCQKRVKTNPVKCDSCARFYHANCSGTPKDLFVQFEAMRDHGFRWFCAVCSKNLPPLGPTSNIEKDFVEAIDAVKSEFEEKTKNLLGEISQKILALGESVSLLFDDHCKSNSAGIATSPSASPSYAAIVRETTPSVSDSARPNRSTGPPREHTAGQKLRPPRGPDSANPRKSQLGEVKSSRRRNAIVGKGNSGSLRTVAPPERRRNIFISRLHPDTTEADIITAVESKTGINIVCSKLKTRFDSYASFCVGASADSFESLMNPEVWDEGVLFKPFRHVYPRASPRDTQPSRKSQSSA